METSQKHPHIYFISGLGGDGRLFDRLKEEGLDFTTIEYLVPEKKESFRHYAERMAASIDTSEPYIIGGVSFGGMLSTEIAKFLNPELVILISTCKHTREFPFYLKAFRYLPVYKLVSGNFIKKLAPMAPHTQIGKENRTLLDAQKRDADPRFIKWAVHQVVWWRNREIPKNYIHIHGGSDPLLIPSLIRDKIIIPKGSHVMVLDKAKAVKAEIQKALVAL